MQWWPGFVSSFAALELLPRPIADAAQSAAPSNFAIELLDAPQGEHLHQHDGGRLSMEGVELLRGGVGVERGRIC